MNNIARNRIIAFGTFDIFHKGHENFLKQAKKYGDYLIVVIARDKTVLKIKGKLPRNNEQARLQAVVESGLADKMVLGNLKDKYKIIGKFKPDVICLGYDQEAFTEKLGDKFKKYNLLNTKIVRLKPYCPEKYKSSMFRITRNKNMKIAICGSSAFRKNKIKIKEELENLGHIALIHPDYEAFAKGKKQELWNLIQTNHAQAKKQENYIKWYYNAIVNSDAILVCNFNKNRMKNYIGGNVLIEIGFAHVHDKKIFLFNPLPENCPYIDEIKAMYDEIINGDLTKIK